MRKLLIASAAIVGFTGIAAAQEAPALIYSDAFAQNVQNAGVAAMDGSMTVSSQRNVSLSAPLSDAAVYDIRSNENYSGR